MFGNNYVSSLRIKELLKLIHIKIVKNSPILGLLRSCNRSLEDTCGDVRLISEQRVDTNAKKVPLIAFKLCLVHHNYYF
jgi:hypothetical protein